MACTYKAPNGNSSNLYNAVASNYNEATARFVWLSTKSQIFKERFNQKLEMDNNGEPTLESLEKNNLIMINEDGLPEMDTQDDVKIYERKRQLVVSAFINAGIEIDTEIVEDLESSGKVMTKNNRPTIQYSPFKGKTDTWFHEGGHLLVDMMGGLNNSFILRGISQLQGTKLWKAVSDAYPELEGDMLAKEVLTTAIGLKADEMLNVKDQNKWIFWWNTFMRKLGELFGVEKDVAETLAYQLVNGKIKETLDSRVKIEEQLQKDLEIVNTVFLQKEKLLEKAGNVIKKKIAIYYKNLSQEEKDSNPTLQQFNELLELFNEMEPSTINQDIVKFLSLMYNQTGALEKRLNQIINPTPKDVQDGKDKVNFAFLRTFIQYNEVFNIIEDLVDIVKRDPELEKELINDEKARRLVDGDVKSKIEQIYSRYTNIKKSAKRITIEMLANWFTTLPGKSRVELNLRLQKEREFNKEHAKERTEANKKGGKIKAAFKQKRKDFIDRNIENEMVEIQRKELERYKILLEQSDFDISWMSRMFLDGDTVNDEIINIVSEVLDRADHNTMTTVNDEYRKLIKLVKEYEKVKNSSDQKKKYDDLIEDEWDMDDNGRIFKTGKKNNYLVGKYNSSYSKVRNKAWKDYQELKEKEKNGIVVSQGEFADALAKVKKFDAENSIVEEEWVNGFPKVVSVKPNDKWINDSWKKMQELREQNSPIAKLYDYLVDRIEQDDKLLPEWAKLGKDYYEERQYKLPSIIKSGMESLGDGTMLENVKNRTKNIFKKEDDTEFGGVREEEAFESETEGIESITGEPTRSIRDTIKRYMNVLVNEVGQERHTVPIYFRHKTKNEDQSFDLPSIMLLNHYMTENYKNKLDIQPQVELTLDLVKERTVPQTGNTGFSGIKYKIDALLSTQITKIPVTKTGEDSNAFKALESMVSDRLYGLSSASSVSAQKIANAISSYTGNVTLIGNYLSAGANLAFGITAEWIESIGGIYFNKKNLTNAHVKYTKELANGALLNDFGARNIKSKTSLLIEKYNALADWKAVSRAFLNDSRVKMLTDTKMLHFLNGGAEHMMQSTLMYAVLDNTKASSLEGDYLTIDGTTKNKEEAASLDELMKVTENGLVLDERVKFVELPMGKVEYNKDTTFLISRLIKDLNAELHGQYSNQKKSEIQRYWYGTLIMLLRKWMPRGVIRRWRGIQSAGIPIDQMLMTDHFFSRPGMSVREGYYTTTTRFLWNLISQGKQLKWEMVTTDWSKLTDYERANIRKTAYEFALMVALYGMSVAMKGLGDDEKDERSKEFWYLIAFYSYRLHSELNTYINPVEATKLLKNPSAALTLVSRGLHLLTQLTTNPFEEYERGDRKGQLKIRKDIEDLVPIIKQIDRNVEDALTWMFSPRVI